MNAKPQRVLLVLVTIMLLISSPSRAQGQSHYLPTGHVHEAVLNGQAKLVGHVPGSQTLRFDVTLSLSRPAELQQFLQAVYDKSNPQFRQFVTPEQFTERFGPTQSDSDQVVAFAQKNGFRLLGGSRHQMNLQLEGSAAAIESAFNIKLNTYQHPVEKRLFYSPDREPTTEGSLAIWHISGLDNFAIPHPVSLRNNRTVQSDSSLTLDGAYLSSTWRTAYYGGALTGSGQTVGIIEWAPFNPADVAYTLSSAGQSTSVAINPISIAGASPVCTTTCDLGVDAGEEGEPVLDIVQVAAMAPGLKAINVYVGGLGTDTAMLSAVSIHSPLDKQISSSLAWNPADPAADEPYFWRFAAQGQSFFEASGDHASYQKSSKAAAFAYPAEDPWVTAVGGTALSPNPSTGAWESEVGWSGSGGGYSPDGLTIPWYQTYPTQITYAINSSTTLRNVPDVSANAGAGTYICVGTAVKPTGDCGGWVGTSAAAPLWAGYMALVNEQAALNSESSIGFINPYIYDLASSGSYESAFHDITTGTNGSPAGLSYDLVTGWGSPNGAGLLSALTGNSFHRIANPIGVTASGPFPYVFVKGSDGNLWLNYATGSTWPWSNLDTPIRMGTIGPPVQISIASAVGVVAGDGLYPYVFVEGSDGNLWCSCDTGAALKWGIIGKPISTSIAGAVGATMSGPALPFVFVTGADGNLWLDYDNGSAWNWDDLGRPSGTSIAGAVGVTASGPYPYVFVTGADGNLWLSYDDGSGWPWVNLGKPSSTSIAGAVGVIASGGVYPCVFVTGADGNLWMNYATGSGWEWRNLGKPSSTSIAGAVGVTASGPYPYVFVTGADGNLWVNYDTNGTTWEWVNLGKPSSTSIAGAVGVTASGPYPYVFVAGADGNLWLNYDTGSAWKWLNLGQP